MSCTTERTGCAINTSGGRISRLVIYYSVATLQGICAVLIPASSFLLDGSEGYTITSRQYGSIYLPLVAMAIVCSLSYNRLACRYGRRRLYYGGICAYLAYLACLYATSLFHNDSPAVYRLLLSAFLFSGAAFGILMPTLNCLCGDAIPRYRAGVLAGLHGCFGVGASLAPWLVNYSYGIQVWEMCFAATAAGFVVMMLASAAVIRKPVFAAAGTEPRRGASVSGLPALAAGFMIAMVLYGTAETMVVNWTTLFLTAGREYSFNTASAALSAFWVFLTVGRFISSGASVVVDSRYIVRAAPVILCAGLAMILFTDNERALIAAYVIVGLGCSCIFPLLTSILFGYFYHMRDRMSGAMVMSLMVGVGIGSFVPGVLKDEGIIGLPGIFAGAALLSVLLAVSVLGITRKPVPR